MLCGISERLSFTAVFTLTVIQNHIYNFLMFSLRFSEASFLHLWMVVPGITHGPGDPARTEHGWAYPSAAHCLERSSWLASDLMSDLRPSGASQDGTVRQKHHLQPLSWALGVGSLEAHLFTTLFPPSQSLYHPLGLFITVCWCTVDTCTPPTLWPHHGHKPLAPQSRLLELPSQSEHQCHNFC